MYKFLNDSCYQRGCEDAYFDRMQKEYEEEEYTKEQEEENEQEES